MRSQNNNSVAALQYASERLDRTVLVLGGYGFVGRYTVKALQRHGVHVLIGTRGLDGYTAKPMERYISLHQALTADSWNETLKGVDVVINTVGILRKRRGESFDAVHHLAVDALARACKAHDIPLIHVSALGIDGKVHNANTVSKLLGEKAIIDSQCAGAIVRTSVVDAPDGFGSGWLHRVANWPVWLIPAGATSLLSPIDASDAGEALARLALRESDKPLERVEIGCGENFTLHTYLAKLRHSEQLHLSKPLFTIRVPQTIARVSAYIFDLLHITPYSIGHHELLEYDNIPAYNQLPTLLGRMPTPIGARSKPNTGCIELGENSEDSADSIFETSLADG